jgi:hypothetical protein
MLSIGVVRKCTCFYYVYRLSGIIINKIASTERIYACMSIGVCVSVSAIVYVYSI